MKKCNARPLINSTQCSEKVWQIVTHTTKIFYKGQGVKDINILYSGMEYKDLDTTA